MKKYQLKQGFALIEILVSAFILTVGLLAIAKLQVYLMQESTLSAEKSKALTESGQMLENIRYNNYQYSNLNIDHIKAANNNSSSASFTFNMLSAATTVADLAQYVTQTKWTDAFGRTQNLYSVSYISSLLQISGSTTGGTTAKNKSGINPIEFDRNKTYYKDSIVKKDGKQYILDGSGYTTPVLNPVNGNTNDPGVNSKWQEIDYYAEGSLFWENTNATHGICTIKIKNADNFKCAPNEFSGITKRTLCEDQSGPSTDCTAVTEKGKTSYYKYGGKYIMQADFSCAIVASSSDSALVELSCDSLQGSQTTLVGTLNLTSKSTLATATKQFDDHTMPLQNLGTQYVSSNTASTIPDSCTPDVIFWEPKNISGTTYAYNAGDAVCYNKVIYVAKTGVGGPYAAYATNSPPDVMSSTSAVWAYSKACTNSVSTPEWTTANNKDFLTVGQKACYQGVEIYISSNLQTTGSNKNTTSLPGATNSKWLFSYSTSTVTPTPSVTTSPTVTPSVTATPSPTATPDSTGLCPTYSNSVTYSKDMVVKYDSKYWNSLTTIYANSNWSPGVPGTWGTIINWNSTTKYVANTFVLYSGKVYKTANGTNKNETDPSVNTKWAFVCQ
ncbi:hypothetical protein HZU75_07800 [Chitinibacter fontanus]|uniref:Type IV pilus modification protein PilV n=1 Tax=Chitinibacter fontanus TaxID=1737446 RepID=A0A7D5V9G5_9NEIS|nr:hypothetical protein [Chitinibacter fontanus]QLI81435.1 hypothetical protein HZU75_07800 [Chitinibacter fontanus]